MPSDSDGRNEKIPVIVVKLKEPYRVLNLKRFHDCFGKQLPVRDTTILCRCGKSRRKPFCDGSHGSNGIDGYKHPDRPRDRTVSYRGEELVIHDNRAVCSHDRSCVRYSPRVFNRHKKRWINPDGDEAEKTINTIKMCPSGSLSYTFKGELVKENPDREPAIKIAENGPYEIVGGIILDDDQDSLPESKEHYCLCRCGGSKNKPFCDGTHRKQKFRDDI